MDEKERQTELQALWDELDLGRARVRGLNQIEQQRTLTQAEIDERSMLNTRNNNIVAAIGELQSRIL